MKKYVFKIVIAFSLVFLTVGSSTGFAFDTAPRISDREIVERLTRLEEGQKAILREMDTRFAAIQTSMDQRFEAMEKRFESIDKRFESIDNRFETMDKRFEEFQNLVIGILASFSAIVAVTIGFAIWDRRTAIKPVENKMDLLIEELSTHKETLSNVLNALKKKSETDKDLAAVLRSFSIL